MPSWQVCVLGALWLLSHPGTVWAHMEMSWPYAFRSKYDPAVSDPDYDNTSPLVGDGSNYPCKGYLNLAAAQVPKADYVPGETYNITLAGTARHDGGSCQISLSYDNGQSFHVVKSMVGGCPLKDSWSFTVPSDAPSSDTAVLSWTWFNLVGNREMYMNCARVRVVRPSARRWQHRHDHKRQSPLGTLPAQFVCNIGTGCTTVEQHQVVFPDPGPDVETNVNGISADPGPGYTMAPSATTVLSSTVPGTSTWTANPGTSTEPVSTQSM